MKTLLLLALAGIASAGDNVLLIIADDFGVDSQSLYNATAGATPPTPNINALAAAGMRFTNAYACPVCSPTRACILTGRLGFRTGIGNVVSLSAGNSLTAADLTLPEVIIANPGPGIQCAQFGKWHLTIGPNNANRPNTVGGWPHFAGALSGEISDYYNWPKVVDGVSSTSATYATTDVVNDTVAWIGARTAASEPWFAWVAFNAPHLPFHIPPASLQSYGTTIPGNLNKYRAAVEAMDTEIGRLLLTIDPATTDVIFLGDNGTPGQVIQAPYDSTHAKGTLYEGGVRVPLIVRGPGVQSPGSTSDALVHVVDLFSTILELADVPLPTSVTLDSRSLKPILAGETVSPPARLYAELFDQSATTTGGRVLRDDHYKIIRLNTGIDEFHDLLTDPAETTNLLASGITAMSATHQAYYHRLRFNLGDYTNITQAAPTSHAIAANGFSLTVAENPAAVQTMWQSTDLDFWIPVIGATQSTQGGNITFTAPPPLPDKVFYSILTETP